MQVYSDWQHPILMLQFQFLPLFHNACINLKLSSEQIFFNRGYIKLIISLHIRNHHHLLKLTCILLITSSLTIAHKCMMNSCNSILIILSHIREIIIVINAFLHLGNASYYIDLIVSFYGQYCSWIWRVDE